LRSPVITTYVLAALLGCSSNLTLLLFCMLLQNEMKDAHDALHACKKQAALVQDSLNVRTVLLLLTMYPGVWFVKQGLHMFLYECGVVVSNSTCALQGQESSCF
jgi:Na+/H+ antiporter NhaB